MPTIDYDHARKRLEAGFLESESAALSSEDFDGSDTVSKDIATIFASTTQAYREALLGCVLAKLEDANTDITKPYVSQSAHAFNGRTLDERVINAFLHTKRIPSSKGPYLSTFRRSVDFSEATRGGVRDKGGYDCFLRLIHYVEGANSEFRERFLVLLLTHFIKLREGSAIPIAKLNRVSLIQYERLIDALLGTSSGGRMPVMLVVSMFFALREHFGLDWQIESQGINEADAARSAGGDITIRNPSGIVLVAEVTERVVDKSRIVSTFNTKISPAGLEEYVFFVNEAKENAPAIAQAQQYFAQGSEVNFADIRTWLRMSLVTIGKGGRSAFNSQLGRLLDSDDTPRSLKVAWNDLVAKLTSV